MATVVCPVLVPFAVGAESLGHLQALNHAAYHRVHATVLDRPFHAFVRLPEDHEASDRAYPTIYLLDGGVTFPLLAGYYPLLRADAAAPEAVLVGISYGTGDPEAGNFRHVDYTAPTSDNGHAGRAPDYKAFLADQLIPLVERTYRADPARRVLFGQSRGGQFVLYAALTEPDLFWGHIASNPAIHRNLPFFLRHHAPSGREPARLFVSSAEHDWPALREAALQWSEHWAGRPSTGWDIAFITLNGETHASAAPTAFRRALDWLFSDTRPPGQ